MSDKGSTMGARDKQKRLVNLLIRNTFLGELRWQPTQDPTAFIAALRTGSVRVSLAKSVHGRTHIEVETYTGEGALAEVFSDSDLDAFEFSDRPWHRKMKDLHESARRASTGSDKVINDLLAELNEVSPF
jgi:hypothetical protein